MDTTTYRIDGHHVHEHHLDVPLVHGDPTSESITIFARELVRDGGADRPRLVWFQGGPGNRANRPDSIGGWLDRALEEYRVVLLDQRGTGLSTPADRTTLLARGGPEEQADHLSHFRADAIAADAELLRMELGAERWTALGQSFGGFVTTTYLSRAPQGLEAAIITAGLPSLTAHADDVYRLTYRQAARRNEEYFARHPADEATAHTIARHLEDEAELLPTGERLSARRFRQLGINLGTASGFDSLHYLLEDPFITVNGTRRLRERLLVDLGQVLSFATHPLYAVMHESIYAQGGAHGSAHGSATAWSADRVRTKLPEFTLEPSADGPFRFTGEHVYPWQFDEDPYLAPLRDVADRLAHREDFPALYDVDALRENTVPVVAAVFHDDMFVPREHSLATAAEIRGARLLITNAYQHDGIRVDGRRLLDQLLTTLRR